MDIRGYRELFAQVTDWGRWGPDDELGALNYISADRVRGAATLVRTGRSVALGRPWPTRETIDNRKPAIHAMTRTATSDEGIDWNTDFIGADYHGKALTHIDSLAHCVVDGHMYNGVPRSAIDDGGATRGGIGSLQGGIVGRGVLLDVARARGVKWLDPGTAIPAEELQAVESEESVRATEGDILLIRTGHEVRQRELGSWDSNVADAGLDVDVAPWLHQRRVAVIGSDGDSDASPSVVDGIQLPVHGLALVAMGMPVIDNLCLDDLANLCEQQRRWEFLIVIAPLKVPGATGSPVNPIAVL